MPAVSTLQPAGSFVPPEAPLFRPTPEEFEHPLRYIASIRPAAEAYGICKIIPPAGWKPPYVLDRESFRFKTRIQSVHELQERPDTQEAADLFQDDFTAFLQSTGRPVKKPPVFGGTPIDLAKLYKVVLRRGGYETVTQSKGWRDVGRLLQVGRCSFACNTAPVWQLARMTLVFCSLTTRATTLLTRFGKCTRSICWPMRSTTETEKQVHRHHNAHLPTLARKPASVLANLATMLRRLQIYSMPSWGSPACQSPTRHHQESEQSRWEWYARPRLSCSSLVCTCFPVY